MSSKISGSALVVSMNARWILLFIAFVGIAYLLQCNFQLMLGKLHSLGMFAPFVFLALYCLASVFFLPTILLVLAGGALFGLVAGTLLNLLGATMGAVCGFCISRYLTPHKSSVIRNVRMDKWMSQVERRGWKAVALLRLTPAIPYNLINYGLGLTRIKFSHYLMATTIFLIPNKIIVTYCGYYGINVLERMKIMYLAF